MVVARHFERAKAAVLVRVRFLLVVLGLVADTCSTFLSLYCIIPVDEFIVSLHVDGFDGIPEWVFRGQMVRLVS